MNLLKMSTFGAVVALLGLGSFDTAWGQSNSLTASPPSLNITVQSGGTASKQVSVSATNEPTTLNVSLVNTPSWMTVNNYAAGSTFNVNTPSDGSPQIFTIAVNAAGLTTNQVGTFTIQINALPSSLITYDVYLTVGGPTSLSSNPQTLGFSAVQGSNVGNPNSIPVTVTTSNPQPIVYTVSASTTDGATWILLSTTSATTSNTTPGFNVYVNPTGLAVGNYTGTITIQSTTSPDSLAIPVTLQVTQGQLLNVTGTLNDFFYQYQSGQGGFTPQTQTLMVSTNTGSLNYTVTATSGQTTNWLVFTPLASTATTTPQALNLYLSYQYVANLAPGTYTITLAISGGGQTVNETVTLIVSTNPLLTVTPKSLSFTIPFGTTASPSQTVTVGSSNPSIPVPYLVTVSPAASSWLSASPLSGSTVTNPVFSVFINPSVLNVTTTPYTGNIIVSPNNSDYGLYSITIPVTVTVTSATTQIYAGPDQLLFSYQTGKTTQNLPQLVNLSSPGAVGFSVATSVLPSPNCPSTNWLAATPTATITPAQLSVSVSNSGMTAGTCSGTVTVTYNNGQNPTATTTIPVTVNISATPLLTISTLPGFGVVTANPSTGTITSQITINSTDGSALGFTASATQTGGTQAWLALGATSGQTIQNLVVYFLPSGLQVGVYTGSITISANNAANLPSGPLTIPVVLTVTQNTTVTVSPTTLAFTQTQGGTPPASQPITLTASSPTTYTASATTITGGNWLQVTPASGTISGTTATITATVAQNSLSPGAYNGTISLYFPTTATSATVNVTLTVTPAQTVTVSPTSLAFSYQLGGAAPGAQTLTVASPGTAVSVTAAASTTGSPSNWLSVTPTSGTTDPRTGLPLNVSIATTGFTTPGTYNGTIAITPAGSAPISVGVTFTVTGVPVPQPATISNSASGAYGAIAPGEIITIKGTAIGPGTPVSFSVNPGNTVSNTLAGVQVLFDGIPGTPTYVSSTQINVIVPYEIAGRAQTTVVVSYQSQQSAGITQTVANQAPGIYTFSATGAGQAAALNQNGTFNGPAAGIIIGGQPINTTPASAGQVIAIYMTGGGQTNPQSTTGTVTPTSPYYLISGVTATINGVPATVAFAGAAPALVTGVIQVNLVVPPNVHGNNLSLLVTINGSTSLIGPTVAVQ
ncbi:MAG TPA: hypothetical protein VMT15_12525 [Bryobacteraceae bacterium]|nr:hypothetical protein [Bryobacteraceae bacterium]